MLHSQEIKIATVTGTVVLILSSYLFSSETIYNKLNPSLEQTSDISGVDQDRSKENVVSNIAESIQTETIPEIEEGVEVIENQKTTEIVKDTLETATKVAMVDNLADITTKTITKLSEAQKIRDTKTVADKNHAENSKESQLHTAIKKMRYLTVESNGSLTEESKRFLDTLLPSFEGLDGYTLTIEGYSDGRKLLFSPQTRSEHFAKEALAYMRKNIKGMQFKTVGWGDAYPIIGDLSDHRNNRVELKLRRR